MKKWFAKDSKSGSILFFSIKKWLGTMQISLLLYVFYFTQQKVTNFLEKLVRKQ